MSTPRVFVPNDSNFEHTNLHTWGRVTPIFSGHVYPDTMYEMEEFQKQALKELHTFDRDVDMLAMVGDPALQALAIMVVGFSLSINKLTVLKYDKKLAAYYPVTMRMS